MAYGNRFSGQMNQTEFELSDSPANQREVATGHDSSAKPKRADHRAGQLLATIWIVAAWLIGTLISELNVMGQTPTQAGAGHKRAQLVTPLIERWQNLETEYALVCGGLEALDRLEANLRLSAQPLDIPAAVVSPDPIAADRTQPTTINSLPGKLDLLQPLPPSRCEDVGFAYDLEIVAPPRPTLQRAWGEFDEDSLLGTVDQMAHSLDELLPPVEVQPIDSVDNLTPLFTTSIPTHSPIFVVDEGEHRSSDRYQTSEPARTASEPLGPPVRQGHASLHEPKQRSERVSRFEPVRLQVQSTRPATVEPESQRTPRSSTHRAPGLVAVEDTMSANDSIPMSDTVVHRDVPPPVRTVPDVTGLVSTNATPAQANPPQQRSTVEAQAQQESTLSPPSHHQRPSVGAPQPHVLTARDLPPAGIPPQYSAGPPAEHRPFPINSPTRAVVQRESAQVSSARRFLAGKILPPPDAPATASIPNRPTQHVFTDRLPVANHQVRVGTVQDVLGQPRIATNWPLQRLESESKTDVTLNIDGVDVRTVFEMLARGYKMNILVAPEVTGTVTATVEGLTPQQTLQGIVKMCNLSMQQEGDLIYIYPSDKVPSDRRQLRVFTLDFARATMIEPTIQGLLSPVGNAYTSTMSESDNMQTQESIVVVDVPEVISQVEEFVLQADRAPRQVLIEAKILEVELGDEMEHGIDYRALLSGDATAAGAGFVTPLNAITVANPVFYGQIQGSDLDAVIQLLETTTDSKTLASPRVHVLNGQNAKIQVGQQLGFTVATVTQTSTVQDVQFLETGVVLTVTPTISRDNRILMKVKPEVSDGEINPATLLPEEETREVETSVLLDNHCGMVIGGLIQERDRTVIKKLPWLGDLRHVGKFFQHRTATRSRTEIIVALIPHIVEPGVQDEREAIEYQRADTPLYHGLLQRNCRPWEPRMPDVAAEHDHMDVNKVNRRIP